MSLRSVSPACRCCNLATLRRDTMARLFDGFGVPPQRPQRSSGRKQGDRSNEPRSDQTAQRATGRRYAAICEPRKELAE